MTAYVVPRAHIDAMTYWMYKLGHITDRDAVGQALHNENVASVAYRYGQCLIPREYKYQSPQPVATACTTRKPFDPRTSRDIEMYFRCYMFNSSEHPGWRTSKVKELCELTRKDLPQSTSIVHWAVL